MPLGGVRCLAGYYGVITRQAITTDDEKLTCTTINGARVGERDL